MIPPRARSLATALLLLAGCAYTLHPPFRDDFRTIYLETFGNRTYRRDLEFRLTRLVEDELLARTHYDLAPRDEADVVLSGEIEDVTETVLAEDRVDRVREERVTTTVDVRLTRRRTGEVIQQWRVRDPAEFVLDLGESLDTALEESFSDLAERIVQGLEDPRFRLPGTAPRGPEDGPDTPGAGAAGRAAGGTAGG